MRIANHVVTIARPREAVFDFFIDLSKAARWRQYVVSMELLSEPPLRQASRIRTTMALLGGQYTFDLEVLAFERPSLWRHRSFETHFNGYIEYRFEPDGAGTRVTMTIDANPRGLYGWLAVPILWLQRARPYKEQLPRLKRAMEDA